ncbi:hypothetical protein H0176_19910 [Methylorubrum populi]|jgi:hypothetical protein|uniref:Uncharacterized protein n=1 Tax=Methylorubrum rhodesianum TaxID=29427 RepID=A0ABU9ZJ16_9HYPH|nr:hypothetical protein [Methylorubrum rhodesianum]MBK3401274.1 hypothetical protein [Methylorubrum rhodesianum]MBY0142526.1 hypothetical protein [Methylorubrum populi]
MRRVSLTWAEALQQVVGPRRLGDLQRVVEGQGGLSEFFAARPGQIDAAGQAGLDALAPASPSSARTGEAVQAAARSAVAATPEGQAVIRATQAAGPRVSPDQAGQVIQREMRGVADAREAARSEQAARDYAAARAAPERIGIERTVEVERPGEPVLQTLDNGAGGPLRYDPPPQGPDTIGSMAPKRPDAPPVAPGTKSLARFIAENGGIGLERGDVKAAGLDRFRQPGVSNLVQENGKGIDNFWRERLIEEGYLPPDRDGGMARNIHDELIGLLEQEARGRRTYPWDWLGHDDRSGFGALRDEFQASASQATTDIRRALTEAGVDPKTVDKGTLDRAAAALMRGDELGRIAERPDVKNAIDALFPTEPVEGSAADVGAAVGAISRSNPLAARELVRTYLGTEFAAKTKDLQSGANQAGGAKFAASIRGNDLAGENIFAAIRALPDGERLAAGFSRLLDIFEATGTRQGVGSRTSFNNEALAELRKGGLGGEANKALATGGLNLPKRIAQGIEDWQAGRNVDGLAALLTTPEGGRRLADLANAKPGADTIALLNRLMVLGARGAGGGDRDAREALQLKVRAVP